MRIRTLVSLALTGTLAVSAGATMASAQSHDRRTFFEFNTPVAVPGVTLPPGKYLFRVTETTQRDVLQVLSPDGSKTLAQFYALRANRTQSTPVPEVRFMETGPNVPAAIDTWWHPSELGGYEFVYPDWQRQRLLAGRPTTVKAAEAEPLRPAPQVEVAAAAPPPARPPVFGEPAPESIPVVEPAAPERVALSRSAGPGPTVLLAGMLLLLGSVLLVGLRAAYR
jgi:hypothetical protein